MSNAAFPVMPPLDTDGQARAGYPYPEPGMSQRAYVATKALAALLELNAFNLFSPNVHDRYAEEAIKYADALIQKLQEKPL